MGRRKPKQFVILFLLFIFIITSSCLTQQYDPSKAAITLTGISWIEKTIEIYYTRVGERKLNNEGLTVNYKKFPLGITLFTEVIEEEYYSGYRGTITADLTNIPITVLADAEMTYNDRGWLIYKQTFVVNQEAVIQIDEEGGGTGGVSAEVFIGEGRIDILSQRYYDLRWFSYPVSWQRKKN